MKFIHLSDPHLQKDNFHLYGLDPYIRLELAIKSINKNFKDIDFIVITGDLTQDGSQKAYRKLRKIIKKAKAEVILLMGNHDNRENFIKIFKNHPVNNNFIQTTKTIDKDVFIYLDTKIENSHAGDMCDIRFKWFEEQLEKNKDKNCYIFMHHPPMQINIPIMDKMGFKSKKRLKDLFKKYSNIKYIFFGHIHRITSGVWADIPYFGIRGTNHQLSFKHSIKYQYTTSEEKPAFGIVNIDLNDINIHIHEYLDEDKCYLIED